MRGAPLKCTMQTNPFFLRSLGVFGFDSVELLILASLVSEDPILLIGKSGTGKTYLLNSISEALSLRHRHYNASLIAFDDLIGFPYPTNGNTEIRFIPTPATIWNAESVLVDELSRCKPEIQNKFFSLVQERKIQGIALENLRFRWAAMNPFDGLNETDDEHYTGSQPLDPALADRFAFLIVVPDWSQLSTEDQEAIIRPVGEGAITPANPLLQEFVNKARRVFLDMLHIENPEVTLYCRAAATMLNDDGLRISPRRARLLARNITAVLAVMQVQGKNPDLAERKKLYKLILRWSMPHRAFKDNFPEQVINSVNAEAMRLVQDCDPGQRWLAEFFMTLSLKDRLAKLLGPEVGMDLKSLAVLQMISREIPERKAAFAFAAFPFLMNAKILNEEAVHALSQLATQIIHVDKEIDWSQRGTNQQVTRTMLSECAQFINRLSGSDIRKNRAQQYFLYLLSHGYEIPDFITAEIALNELFDFVNSKIHE